ncbi:MAG TPA: DUF4129 domain-containing protein [Longimicrobium sp.]|nr:DUF4129 domain-containing protein [Longimicrobium sp.]
MADVAGGIPTAQQVQQAVARVYARPEFQEQHRRTWGDWVWSKLAKVFHWIAEHLRLVRGLEDTRPGHYWALIIGLVVLLVALLGHITWTALRVARMGDEVDAPAADKGKRPKPRTAADWEAEAMRLAAEGRLREAAAALYQSLLLRLDALGVVRFDRSKTPGDYRREARKHPEAATALGAFLRLFEPVAFGGRDLDAEGWERLRAAAEQGGAGA